jgi:hypothetical protein
MAYGTVGVLPSALRTTSSSSAAAGPLTGNTLALQLNVTTQQGTTPTLDVSIQWSMDGTTWSTPDPTADTFTQVTATTPSKVKNFTVKGQYFRVAWTIGGTVTPGYTFDMTGYVTL